MKKTLLFLCKFIAAGMIALAFLSAFSLIYFNPPVAVSQPDGYTNSKYSSNTFWSYMTEGFGIGKTNNIGYNDQHDFDSSNPIIAVMGSSQTEALEVSQTDSFVSLLQNKLFQDNTDHNNIDCLNLGISGHSFGVCVSNFEALAESFDNIQCAVIETGNISFSAEQLNKMLNNGFHEDMAPRSTLYSLAQKIPYLRLLYKKYKDIKQTKIQATTSSSTSTNSSPDYIAYEMGMDLVMKKLATISTENGFDLAILYHSYVKVENGQGYRSDDPQLVEIFRRCCESNGIRLIDVSQNLVDHFNKTYELPYGFSNTTMGSGHLNKIGHEIIADVLFTHITEMTEDN